jgi:hypothetical protein
MKGKKAHLATAAIALVSIILTSKAQDPSNKL